MSKRRWGQVAAAWMMVLGYWGFVAGAIWGTWADTESYTDAGRIVQSGLILVVAALILAFVLALMEDLR